MDALAAGGAVETVAPLDEDALGVEGAPQGEASVPFAAAVPAGGWYVKAYDDETV
ncbi:hypothetical protein ACRAWC_24040 [Leifsonia sp. L25]|uniref:hypothetical protein n=1 Tax=Leifsonia sp. L25 TaxID=3423957 RepID=UPI003D69D79C